jgi:hypothetical protein
MPQRRYSLPEGAPAIRFNGSAPCVGFLVRVDQDEPVTAGKGESCRQSGLEQRKARGRHTDACSEGEYDRKREQRLLAAQSEGEDQVGEAEEASHLG